MSRPLSWGLVVLLGMATVAGAIDGILYGGIMFLFYLVAVIHAVTAEDREGDRDSSH